MYKLGILVSGTTKIYLSLTDSVRINCTLNEKVKITFGFNNSSFAGRNPFVFMALAFEDLGGEGGGDNTKVF